MESTAQPVANHLNCGKISSYNAVECNGNGTGLGAFTIQVRFRKPLTPASMTLHGLEVPEDELWNAKGEFCI
jgi:hypothetical protein